MNVDARALSARIIRFADEVSAARSSARMAMELMAANLSLANKNVETVAGTIGLIENTINSIPNLNNIIQ